mgnify:CR=1 FL=1
MTWLGQKPAPPAPGELRVYALSIKRFFDGRVAWWCHFGRGYSYDDLEAAGCWPSLAAAFEEDGDLERAFLRGDVVFVIVDTKYGFGQVNLRVAVELDSSARRQLMAPLEELVKEGSPTANALLASVNVAASPEPTRRR